MTQELRQQYRDLETTKLETDARKDANMKSRTH